MAQSLGATDMLQLAGAEPDNAGIIKRWPGPCESVAQSQAGCSSAASSIGQTGAGRADFHASRPYSVSPVTSLLFDVGAAGQMNARVLLVSGHHDWVRFPPGQKPSCRWQQEARNVGGGHKFAAGQRRHSLQRAPHWPQGVAPWARPVAGLDEPAFAARACKAAPGPNASVAVAARWLGGQHLPLVNVTPQLKKLPVPPIP